MKVFLYFCLRVIINTIRSNHNIFMYKDSSHTLYKSELRSKIQKVAMREFLAHGIKSVKMDDIANCLGISKRTLYEIYANKEDLLFECVRMHEEENDKLMAEYVSDKNHSVIDIIIEFYKRQIKRTTDATPEFFAELHKYSKVVVFIENRQREHEKSSVAFFKRGVDDGFFRPDIDYSIVMKMVMASMEYIMKEKMYREYDLKHILYNVTFLFIRGLCTAEGIKRIDTFLQCGQ